MKLACSSMLAQGDTIGAKLAFLKRLGFEGVELRIPEMQATPEYLAEIEAALAASGLGVACIIVPSPAFAAPLDSVETKQAKLANAKIGLNIAARLGGVVMITPEYRPQSPLPLWNPPPALMPTERELLLGLLGEVGDYAEKVSALAVIEPINRYETHFYHRLEQAARVCEEVGSPRLGIVADFFHMNIEERDVAAAISNAAGHIFHVQLGDSNRMLPGQGHTDFTPGFTALKRSGYARYMALECLVEGDPPVAMPACMRYLREHIDEAPV